MGNGPSPFGKAPYILVLGACLTFAPSSQAAEEKGLAGPLGARAYWEDGIHFDSPKQNLRFKINGRAYFDVGSISANSALDEAFPDREGWHSDFRTLEASIYGWIGTGLEFKLSIDFANVRQIKDNWFRLPNLPILKHFRIGNIKEPFSLEQLTSGRFRTFMETSLATYALTPGRDIGILTGGEARERRMSWSAGLFLNTGSLSTVGDTKDEISQAAGWNLTGRVTGLPWYEEEGRRLLHLGLGYSHQFRHDEQGLGRTYPESRLTDDKLVDTGEFDIEGGNLVGAEAALVHGPFSLQGELMAREVNGSGNPVLWGFYGYGSVFLTGEHRHYQRDKARFHKVTPLRSFPPWKDGWGALELALRFSAIDLNDGDLRGGKERNVTAAINWHLTEQSRLMFNYVNVRVDDRANPPAVDSGREQTYAARFQYWF